MSEVGLSGMKAPASEKPAPRPAAWEDLAVFRETFLVPYLPPEAARALRIFGRWLYCQLLENRERPPSGENSVRLELGAAAADLRQIQGFLHDSSGLGKSDFEPQDADLVFATHRLARELGKIATDLERELKAGSSER